jgi:lipoprotein-anchoring transpeptidase ErfK/SrfK
MMIRLSGAVVLALAAALATPAAAQYNSSPAPYYRSAPPDDAGAPSRILPFPEDADNADATPLPPPPFVRERQSDAPGAGSDVDYALPPGQVGSATHAAPVAPSEPAATPQPVAPSATAALPPEDQPETGNPKELPSNLRRQLVNFPTREPAGTIIIDTPNTYLYLILGHGKAIRYGIGVGREGFTWAGSERISRMKEWPDWFPPKEMIERQPYLPRMMAGGPGNPLGARALYLGHTLYRIHGTNQPSTIGKTVSSGCIRLLNKDIEDLYNRVQVGSRVVVLPGQSPSPDEIAGSGNAPLAPNAQADDCCASPYLRQQPRESGTAISGAPLPRIR